MTDLAVSSNPPTVPRWPREARWLHGGIAICISWQLLSSLWMSPDWRHAAYGSFSQILFSTHAWIGLTTALLLLWQWLWLLSAPQYARLLFPGRAAWPKIGADLRTLLRGKLPPPGPVPGLSGLVHGLGLLLVSWMALTGTAIYFFLPQGGTPPGPLLESLLPLHKALHLLLWVYWCGHVGLALLHLWARDGSFGIFRLD